MQSLWAKARRAHRCGWRAYSTTVAGLGRRATNAPRRKATLPEIFTASYSSVLASATLIDAVAKEERRRDLDRQVEETRRELSELREQDATDWVESSIGHLTVDQTYQGWTHLRDIHDNRPYFKEINQPAMLCKSELRERLQRDFYHCSESTLDESMMYKATDGLRLASAYEEVSNDIPRRDPLTKEHLFLFEISISNLVRQLLLLADDLASSSDPHSSYDEAMRLLDAGYPKYQLRSVDIEAANLNTIRINQANMAALHHTGIGIKEKMGRVCYNLLISAYPPDMHTFNSLMIELDGQCYYSLAEEIVEAFFFKTFLRPTPATFAAILFHYNATGNHRQFIRAIGCIAGRDYKTGPKVHSFHIDRTLDDRMFRFLAQNTNRRSLVGNYVLDHLQLNRLVAEEIMRGLVRFHMIQQAVSFFLTCVRTGVAVTTTTIKQVFDGCLMTLDWSAGVRLAQEMSEHVHMWAWLIELCDTSTRAHVVDRMYSILDMIGFGTGYISNERMKELGFSSRKLYSLKRKVRVTVSSQPERLEVHRKRGDLELDPGLALSYSRALQIESLLKELIRVEKTTKSIAIKFLKRPLSWERRTSGAHHVGYGAIERSQRLYDEAQEFIEQLGTEGKLANLEQPSMAEKATSENATQADQPPLSAIAAM